MHRSDILGRTALFAGGSAVTALPPYLTVQMVRFFYKADVQQKAKILRKVCLLCQQSNSQTVALLMRSKCGKGPAHHCRICVSSI
jgi:hypothetical protein